MSVSGYNRGALCARASSARSRSILLSAVILKTVVVDAEPQGQSAPQPKPQAPSAVETNLPVMEVARAVMVTVELDFGTPMPSVADALRQIERRYEPDDGHDRTFA